MEKWTQYWRQWPIAHLTGTGSSGARPNTLFRLNPIGSSRHSQSTTTSAKSSTPWWQNSSSFGFQLRSQRRQVDDSIVGMPPGHADGHPVIRLDRRQHPNLPSGHATFLADGVQYEASFAKGTLAFATRENSAGNALPGLLRGWFGPSAAYPGTSHAVELEQIDGTLLLRPGAVNSDDFKLTMYRSSVTTPWRAGPTRGRRGATTPPPKSPSSARPDTTWRHHVTSCALRMVTRWTVGPIRSPTGTLCLMDHRRICARLR